MTMSTEALSGFSDHLTSAGPENVTIVYDDNTTIPETTTTDDYYYDYDQPFTEFAEYKVAHFINSYYLYVICAVGIPGNAACIVTLLFMKPIVSSAVYMTVLAVVDMIAILLKMVYFQLTAHDIPLGDRGCQAIFLLGTVSQQYSNWLLVAMTIERFIAIWFPFKVRSFCTRKKAIVITSVLLVFFVLANLQFMFTFEEVNDSYLAWDCRPKQKYTDFVQYIWYWLDGALYALIPIIIILILNGLIVFAVRKSSRNQRDLTNSTVNATDNVSQQRQITMMLMTISVVFVLLILPNCIFFIVREYWTWKETSQGIAQYYLFYQLVFLLSDFNHALNFYLYCLSGRKFRQKFIQIICCRRRTLDPASRSYYSHVSTNRVGLRHKTSVTSLSNVSSLNNNQEDIQIARDALEQCRTDCHM